jgi:hypothetical protein
MKTHEAIAEIQQSRSRYQLEHFVIGQHDTPEMRFYQLCVELQDMEHRLAYATLMVRRGEAEIEMLRNSPDPLAAIDADIKELDLEQTRLAMIGAQREVMILRDMFARSPKFTRAEIEQAQPDYWRSRLTRQFELQRAQAMLGVGWAQLEAMCQADLMDRELQPVLAIAGSTG